MPKKSKKDQKVIHIRLDLEGNMKRCFDQIRKDRGLTNSTETIRLLIMEECKRRAFA